MLMVGVIVTILGAILSFVPLAPQPAGSLHTDSSLAFYAFRAGGLSVTGAIPTTVSWSASESVQIVAYTEPGPECTMSGYSGPSGSGYDVPGATAATDSGTSGSFTFEQPESGCMVLALNLPAGSGPVNVTYHVTTAETTFGTPLLLAGIVLVIAGVVLRKNEKGPAVFSPLAEQAPAHTTPKEPEV